MVNMEIELLLLMMVRLSSMKNDIKYIINFFNKKRFLYLIFSFILLGYLFELLHSLTNAIFTFKAIGLTSVFNYISYNLINVLFHNNIISSVLFIFTILFLSIYMVMFISKFKNSPSLSGSGLGILSGIVTFFGLGCVSCGGLIIASLLGTIGVTGILTILPFNGLEIQIFALVISIMSLFVFVRKSRLKVCII